MLVSIDEAWLASWGRRAGGKGGCHFTAIADTNRLCYIHTKGMRKEGTFEGQVKWAVYIFPVKTHFKGQRIWVIEEI